MEPLAEHDPKQIGDFTIIGRIGEGGMGVVYLASKAGRNAALKVIHPLLMREPSAKTRFEREIEVLEKIDSPYVAKILGHGIDEGRAWFATEFVNGPDLKTLVEQEGPLSEEAWNAFANELLEGLAAIHKAGVIHRDIKPSNLVMSDSGLKIIDFGIAHSSDATSITASGFMTGSPAWFSPEQIEGGEITPASDLFSAGSVLVYAASGETPWGPVEGMTKATVFKILAAEPNLANLTTAQTGFVSPLLSQAPAMRDPNMRSISGSEALRETPVTPKKKKQLRAWLVATSLAVTLGLGFALTAPLLLSGSDTSESAQDSLIDTPPESNSDSNSEILRIGVAKVRYAVGIGKWVQVFGVNLTESSYAPSDVDVKIKFTDYTNTDLGYCRSGYMLPQSGGYHFVKSCVMGDSWEDSNDPVQITIIESGEEKATASFVLSDLKDAINSSPSRDDLRFNEMISVPLVEIDSLDAFAAGTACDTIAPIILNFREKVQEADKTARSNTEAEGLSALKNAYYAYRNDLKKFDQAYPSFNSGGWVTMSQVLATEFWDQARTFEFGVDGYLGSPTYRKWFEHSSISCLEGRR